MQEIVSLWHLPWTSTLNNTCRECLFRVVCNIWTKTIYDAAKVTICTLYNLWGFYVWSYRFKDEFQWGMKYLTAELRNSAIQKITSSCSFKAGTSKPSLFTLISVHFAWGIHRQDTWWQHYTAGDPWAALGSHPHEILIGEVSYLFLAAYSATFTKGCHPDSRNKKPPLQMHSFNHYYPHSASQSSLSPSPLLVASTPLHTGHTQLWHLNLDWGYLGIC